MRLFFGIARSSMDRRRFDLVTATCYLASPDLAAAAAFPSLSPTATAISPQRLRRPHCGSLRGGGGDATVVGGSARFEDTTDVIRPFPAVLTAAGQTATFSFTLNVAVANTSEGYEVAFEPASAPFGFGNTNYGSGFALGFDYLSAPAGMSSIQVAEGSGIPANDHSMNNIVQVGNMTTGVAHALSVTLTRGATNTAYSLYLDGSLLRSSSIVINDSRAINSVEIDQAGAAGSPAGSALIDNLVVTPEPGSSVMLALGFAALLTVRRRGIFSEKNSTTNQ